MHGRHGGWQVLPLALPADLVCGQNLCAGLLGQGDAHQHGENMAELQDVPTAMCGKPHGLSSTENFLMVMDHW